MKRFLCLLMFMFIGVLNVNASNNMYYKNEYGVEFTKEQYDFFTNMYYDGYQSAMTKEDINYYDIDYMNPNLVESKYSNNNIISRATSISDANRSLKISKTSMPNYTIITLTLTWTNPPAVKSYDVIGARFSGVTYDSGLNTKLINSSGTTAINNNRTFTNGLGCSVPISGSSIKVTQTFKVTGSGTVYGSYQHANSAISLANSKKYTISSSGYGSVFKFTGTATSVYDQMNGVSITV